ncbi:deoxyribonuclease IV [Ferrimicrobium acidiphilum]|jgi:deoxyribonuclease-4|uniref:Probable endonuclease 4 n=1 Tax=Ferrimicrobium acidiphilum DSM 19497 TaxID=1121877 RepID=A0A0D8FX92_9ACTN|nr:deoxyribonuclease IV [Ferrimicrobium acidiphilum]KJE77883.1 putative endonuclease 4 [Ferrimicrobium acidiphilum DSM 19497]
MRVGAHVSAAGGVDGLIQRANSLGVEAAQFFLSSPRTWKFRPIAPSVAGKTKAVALAQGVQRLVVHASYLINLGSDDPVLAGKSSELLAAVMRAASADQLSAVVLHPGSHKGHGFDASLDRWFNGVEPGLGFASADTRLLLENTAGGGASMGRSVQELRALLDLCARPDAVGICIDTQHLFAAGYDLRDRGVASELAAQLLSEFGDIPVVHLNDSATELGSAHDRHANLGEGAIGLEALIDFIGHEVFRFADIILEVPGSGDGPRVEDVSLLREALKQRE